MTKHECNVTAQGRENFFHANKLLFYARLALEYLQAKESFITRVSAIDDTRPLIITVQVLHPLHQWTVRARQCASADQLSSAEAGSSQL